MYLIANYIGLFFCQVTWSPGMSAEKVHGDVDLL